MALTSDQIKQYYATEGNKANPLSPTAWLAQQTAPKVNTPVVNQTAIPQSTLNSVSSSIANISKQAQTLAPQVAAVAKTTPTSNQSPEIKYETTDPGLYTKGVMDQVETAKTNLNETYQKQIDDLKNKQAEAQKKIDEYQKKEEDALGSMKTLSTPFQKDLETNERERLKVEENYFANQKSISEMEKLMTQAVNDTELANSATSLSVIKSARLNQIKTDYAARVGVIEAVMSARNNQINVAENLIDRSVAAITNDRQGQLNYYKNVLSFYDGLRTEEGDNLISLTKEEKAYVGKQISLLEDELSQAQDNANYIKELMVNPETASAIEQSGVTLYDTPQQVNKKLADYSYKQEVSNQANTMSEKGYSVLLPGATAPLGSQVVSTTDSKGKITQYYKLPDLSDQWGAAYQLGGDWVQKNLATGEIRTAVNVAEGSTTAPGAFEFDTADKGVLMMNGFTAKDVVNIESDLNTYGLEQVEAGLSDTQKKALEQVLSGATPTQINKANQNTFITTDYLKTMFGNNLETIAKSSGFETGGFLGFGKRGDVDAFLEDTMKKVEAKRDAGYTDKEIFDQIQKAINNL